MQQEVQRRRRQQSDALSDQEFTPQGVMLRVLHTHTEKAAGSSLDKMAQNRRSGMLRSQASMPQILTGSYNPELNPTSTLTLTLSLTRRDPN